MNLAIRLSIVMFTRNTYFHTSSSSSGNIAKTMRKIMGKSKKKKHFQDAASLPSPVTFSQGSGDRKSEVSRRSIVLNKLFMKHITDLMVTGQYATEITGLGIEISRVKISSDYTFLKVYWYSRGQLKDSDVAHLLNKNAGYLRHELSDLRVMGNVPSIVFVKDNYYGSVAEVDKRLAVADFGDDYVPLDTGIRLKSEFQIFAPLEDHIKEKIEKLDEGNNVNQFLLPLPQMTHNIYGVNHSTILEKVKKAKKQPITSYSDEYSNKEWAQFKLTQPVNEDPVKFENEKSQEADFREFLRKRQAFQMQTKNDKKYNPTLEYMKECNELSRFPLDNVSFEEDFEEEDYITEDFDKN